LNTTRATRMVPSNASAPLKGHRYYVEAERVQKKRSSEELSDDCGDGYDDYIRGDGHGGDVDSEEHVLKSWKKRQKVEDSNVGIGERASGELVKEEIQGRDHPSPVMTNRNDVGVEGSKHQLVGDGR